MPQVHGILDEIVQAGMMGMGDLDGMSEEDMMMMMMGMGGQGQSGGM